MTKWYDKDVITMNDLEFRYETPWFKVCPTEKVIDGILPDQYSVLLCGEREYIENFVKQHLWDEDTAMVETNIDEVLAVIENGADFLTDQDDEIYYVSAIDNSNNPFGFPFRKVTPND